MLSEIKMYKDIYDEKEELYRFYVKKKLTGDYRYGLQYEDF